MFKALSLLLTVFHLSSTSLLFAQSTDTHRNASQSWNQFRGPHGDGHADTTCRPPTVWDAHSNMAWRTELPGLGWSSPVSADGRIYVTAAVASDSGPQSNQSLRVLCIDFDTGKVLWNVEVFHQEGKDASMIHRKNSHASSTPIVEDDRVYVHFGHMGTACLRAADGQAIWKSQEFRYDPQHGNGGSPIVYNDLLIFSCDGNDMQAIIAIQKTTGALAWRTDRNVGGSTFPYSFSTPTIIQVAEEIQIVSAGSGVVMAVAPENGKEIWRVAYEHGYSVVPKPLYSNGLVLVGTGYDHARLLAIRPDGHGDVTGSHVKYSLDRFVPCNASIVAVDDALYMVTDNGILTCIDIVTGTRRWIERIGGNYSASLAWANGCIYLLDESGTMTVFRPGDSYVEVSKNRLDERTLASIAIDGDAILLRSENALYKIR